MEIAGIFSSPFSCYANGNRYQIDSTHVLIKFQYNFLHPFRISCKFVFLSITTIIKLALFGPKKVISTVLYVSSDCIFKIVTNCPLSFGFDILFDPCAYLGFSRKPSSPAIICESRQNLMEPLHCCLYHVFINYAIESPYQAPHPNSVFYQ